MKRPPASRLFYSPAKHIWWIEDQHYILEQARLFSCSTQCWLHHALMIAAWIIEVYDDCAYWLSFKTNIGV